MIERDYHEVMDAICSLAEKRIKDSAVLFLDSDILENYVDLKNILFRRIEEDGLILVNGTERNQSYISFEYKQMYFVMYADRERYPHQVMILNSFTNLNEFTHYRDN
jgi:hypothetical protein